MAESRAAAAARMRRSRAHAAGDHSLCDRGKCGRAPGRPDEQANEPGEPTADRVERWPGGDMVERVRRHLAPLMATCPTCDLRGGLAFKLAPVIDESDRAEVGA